MPRKKLTKTAESTPEPAAPTPNTSKPAAAKPKTASAKPATDVAKSKPAASKATKPSAAKASEAVPTQRPSRRKTPPAIAPAPEVVQVAEAVSEPSPVRPARAPRAKAAKATPEAAPVVVEPVTEPSPVEEAVASPAKVNVRGRKAAQARTAPQKTAPEKNTPEKSATRKPRATVPATKAAPAPVVAEPEVIEAEAAPVQTRGRSRSRRGGARDVAAPVPTPSAEPAEPTADMVYGDDFDFATLDLPIPIWRSRGSSKAPMVQEPVAPDQDAEEGSDDGSDRDPQGRRRNRRRRRGRGGSDERGLVEPTAAKAPEAEVDEPVDEPEPAQPETQPAAKPERQPSRGRGGRQPRPEAAPVAVAPVAAEPATPAPVPAVTFRRERTVAKAPEKAAIPIPEAAPQIVVQNGVPTLVRNHRVYPPIMFFGSPADEKRAETVLEEVKMAAEAGVHLHSYLLDFEVDPAAVDEATAFAAYILSRSVQIDPESQVIFRLVFQAPRNWEQKFPNARYRHTDGTTAEPSVCDDDFWTVARTCLDRFVRQMRMLDLRDHIMGVHLERGEWFFAEGAGYDDSKAAQQKFRDWARMRYLNDEVTLRASWFDGQARFDNVEIPEYQPNGEEGDRFIRSSRRQRRYVDYHLFLSDATVQRIADLAYTAKAASEGTFLIGASYGYTFEWSHPASGHLSLGKLLRTPEIDFIAGPPSYRSRQPGGSAAFPGPIDSFALNGKLYISEEDFKTSLSVGHEPDDFNPQLKTPQALESVHWRGVGAALAHASGVAWMDLWGNGWLRTHSVWERARKVREAMVDRLAAPLDDPEVAIFIDERALAYLVDDHAFKLLVQNVRESVLRAGVSAAFYLLSDLAHREKFPESKLYIFVNAWDIRPELRAAIKSRLQRDNKVLFWLYSAGLFDAGRESLERAREITGIALKPQPFYSRAGTTILNRRHPLSEAFPDKNLVGGTKLEPSYFAIPEGATVLGEYTQTGLPSFVVREFNEGPADTHWTSVFLGEPQVNPALIRALAQMAGAHVWNFQEDVVHVRHPFCTVHCQSAGPRTLTLPGKYSAYNLLNNDWSAVDSSHVRFTAVEGATYCFLVGARDELEQQLNADPGKLLYIDRLPPREANVRMDSSNFDVPIMKLDEWIEGNDTDDNADEWFLRPQPIEEEPIGQAVAEESPERLGRRRRRRRGGRNDERGGNGGSESESAPTSFEAPNRGDGFEDFGLNVVFRKRE